MQTELDNLPDTKKQAIQAYMNWAYNKYCFVNDDQRRKKKMDKEELNQTAVEMASAPLTQEQLEALLAQKPETATVTIDSAEETDADRVLN